MKNINKPNSLQLCIGLMTLLVKRKLGLVNETCPIKISDYKLIKPVVKTNGRQDYAIGIYLKNKEKYIIKSVDSRINDLRKYEIINEYFNNINLSYILRKNKDIKLNVATQVKLISHKNRLSLVYKLIEGKTLNYQNSTIQRNELLRIIKDLELLSSRLSKEDIKIFNLLNKFYFISSLTLFMPFILIKFNSDFKFIIKSYLIFIYKIVNYNDQDLVLTHRDFIPENIVSSRKKIYLIDLNRLALTYKGYDYAYLYAYLNSKNLLKDMNIPSRDSFMPYFIYLYLSKFSKSRINIDNIYLKTLKSFNESKLIVSKIKLNKKLIYT